jgi:hypothetical protein
VLLVHVGLAGIVAIVFDDLRALTRAGATLPFGSLIVLLIPAWVGVIALGLSAGASSGVLADSPWLWFALTSLTALLMVAAARGRKWALPLIVLVSAVDLGLWGFGYTWGSGGRAVKSVQELIASVPGPPAAQADELVYIPLEVGDRGNLVVMQQLRRSNGYLGLPPASTLAADDPQQQRISGVRWVMANGRWSRADPLARVRLVASARVTAQAADELGGIDDDTALVDRDPGALSGPAGAVHVRMERPGQLEYETESPGRQLLFIAERFHPGWHARIDGAATPVLRAYGDYMAVAVEAGTHAVSLEFAPESFRRGRILTLAGLVLALLGPLLIGMLGRRADGLHGHM